MSENQHTDDLRNIQEGDSVTIETTTGRRFPAVECLSKDVQSADPRTGEIRETYLWTFNVADKRTLTVNFIEGLKSSPDDPDFPVHKEASLGNIGEREGWVRVGYFESVKIHGKMES